MLDKHTKSTRSVNTDSYTVPGVDTQEGQQLGTKLQSCLHNLNDLHLTLKHAHWNVVGPNFIAVHEMLDPQVDAARTMADDVAERMATLGVSPVGTPGALVEDRDWEDYPVGKADTEEHLFALDKTYTRVIENHRAVMAASAEVDPVTEDMLISQTSELELFQWFVRAHLEG